MSMLTPPGQLVPLKRDTAEREGSGEGDWASQGRYAGITRNVAPPDNSRVSGTQQQRPSRVAASLKEALGRNHPSALWLLLRRIPWTLVSARFRRETSTTSREHEGRDGSTRAA